jgi:rod shape-determining protein MreC
MMRRANIAISVVLLLGVLAFFTLSPRNTRNVQSAFLGLLSPFLRTGSAVEARYTAIREGLKSLSELEDENQRLNIENRELKATNQMLRDLEQENNRLREALQYRKRSKFKLIPARIIARDSSTWWNTVMINRGSNEGIEPDMPILTEAGLVGKTTTVAADMSTVLLITDENCRVAANVEGTREQGIMHGERTSTTTQPQIILDFLSKTAALKAGDRVISSGVGGVYPPGIFLGVVKEFKVRELNGEATIIPAVDLATIEDVFIVVEDE